MEITILCEICGEEAIARHPNKKVCSLSCKKEKARLRELVRVVERKKVRRQKRAEELGPRACAACGTSLVGRKEGAKFCTMKCWKLANPEAVKRHWRTDMQKNSTRRRAYYADYRIKNCEALKEKKKLYYARVGRDPEYAKRYRLNNLDRLKELSKIRYQRNKLEAFRKIRERKKVDPAYKMVTSLRSRLWAILKRVGASKPCPTMELVGCSSAELKAHIEKQFKSGMSWRNHGNFWHLDHKKPCAAFDHSDPDQVKECWHFSNLRPLEGKKNLSDGARGFRKVRRGALATPHGTP